MSVAFWTTRLDRLDQPVHRSGNLRFEDREIKVHAEDRPGDAKRVREAVADRGVLAAKRVESRLQRRRARGRAREHAKRFRQGRGAGALECQCDDRRGCHADESHGVGFQSRGGREPAVPFAAVLDAHTVEEEQQAQGAKHSGRRGLRRKGAACEADEQHGTGAEREPLDVDLADQVTTRNDQEERGHRRCFEKGSEPVHAASPVSPSHQRESCVEGVDAAAVQGAYTRGFDIADCRLQTADCELSIV